MNERTVRIYGTIGPACQSRDVLVKMFKEGMAGMRLNLSHSRLREAGEWIGQMKEAAAEAGRQEQLEILIDLQGPELRIPKPSSESAVREWKLEQGEEAVLTMEKDGAEALPVPKCVFEACKPGAELLLDDGKLLLRVREKTADRIITAVERGGLLKRGKSIAVPGADILAPTLTKEDLQNLADIPRFGVTGVMLPFVRNAEDLRFLREALADCGAGRCRILAKIENLSGAEVLPEILPYADEIVIARGDLGNAVPLWKLPKLQKHIAAMCRRERKDFMVVTQMLASMEHCAVPTRAEVSDIYNAVLDGASSVMVTGETAVGEYPAEVMKYLANTVKEALSSEEST